MAKVAILLLTGTAGGERAKALHSPYNRVKSMGVISGVCDYCSGRYSDKGLIQSEELSLTGEARGHPAVASLIKEGYQLIVI